MSLLHLIESAPFRGLQKVSACVLSPWVSGALLAALVCAPDEVRFAVLHHLPLATRALQVLLGVGILSALSRGAGSMAANSWRATAAPGWDWPKEVAVVTGGCSGIGACIVRRLVERGVRVAVLDVQPKPPASGTDDDFKDPDALVRYYQCDITSPASVAEAADAIRRDLGHPTILVNNAGITRPLPILEMPADVLQKVFAVNTLSHWTLVQQFLPHMISLNKGHIMTVASMASFIALPKGADYSASKASALSFHESLALELKHVYKADCVLTSIAHPNFVRTPLVKDFGHQLEKGGIRMLTPEGVAGAITDQIFSRRGAQLLIPEQQAVVSGIRGWPTWMQVVLRDQMGVNAANISVS
ncbi:hypothetical protein E4U47_006232 [Claviceps purpurea]|nr:hypothetical protein E4U47_006232 [Claviceps purpurea]